MAGLTIEIDEATGAVTVAPLRPVVREHKGKSLVEFPPKYVVIDIETTGLDPRFDEIIEVAGIKYDNRLEVGRFQSFVKPQQKISSFITELTGITNEMVAHAPRIKTVLPDFLSFLDDSIIVGHNVHFDINFIYDNAEYLGLSSFTNDFVDTMRISRRLYKDLENHKLSTLVSFLQVGSSVEHRALADCIATYECFVKMQAYADQIGGIPPTATEVFNKLSKTIKPETADFDPDSPIFGMSFAFTGKLERMTRREAMQAVANAGGICCDGVIATTNYLVLGNNDYCKAIKGDKSAKQKKAEKMQKSGMDIVTISEDVFYDMLNSHNVDDQIAFSGYEEPEHPERAFLDRISPDLQVVIKNMGGDSQLMKISDTSSYTAVMFGNLTAFRLRIRGKQHYISIPLTLADLIPNDAPTQNASTGEKYCRILITDEHPLDSYISFLLNVVGETVNRYPKEWDCCSRYLECSNALSCTHPDKTFALGCGYRKILSSGRVYFGKNRNI